MRKSKWLDCQGNEFFLKTKGDSITGQDRAQNTATLDSARSKKKSKVAVLQLEPKVLTCILWFPIWCQCSVVFEMWPNHHLVKATCHLEMLLLVHFVKNLPTKKKDPYLECIVVHKPT